MTKQSLAAYCFLERTSAPNNNWIVLPIVAFPRVLIGIPACQKNQLWYTERKQVSVSFDKSLSPILSLTFPCCCCCVVSFLLIQACRCTCTRTHEHTQNTLRTSSGLCWVVITTTVAFFNRVIIMAVRRGGDAILSCLLPC